MTIKALSDYLIFYDTNTSSFNPDDFAALCFGDNHDAIVSIMNISDYGYKDYRGSKECRFYKVSVLFKVPFSQVDLDSLQGWKNGVILEPWDDCDPEWGERTPGYKTLCAIFEKPVGFEYC